MNVIIVVLDTLRFDYISKISTFLDLTKRGWHFDKMYAPSTFTYPILCSVRSGMYPPRHGWRTWPTGGPFKKNIRTLEDFLSKAGYTILTKMQVPVDLKEDTAHKLIRKKITAKQPFFLYLHCWALHHACFGGPQPERGISKELYSSSLSKVDAFLKMVLAKFTEFGLMGNTLWVVFGDHGLGLEGDKLRGEGFDVGAGQVYDFRVRVPCVIFGPELKPRRVETVHSLVDILPTVLGILDIATEIPKGYLSIQGRSILSGSKKPRFVYLEAQSPHSLWPSERPNVFGATDGHVKVMVTPEGNKCYNLDQNPQENHSDQKLLETRRAQDMLAFIDKIRGEGG